MTWLLSRVAKTSTILACFAASVGVLKLYPLPWGAPLTCILWFVLTLVFLDPPASRLRRALAGAAPLALGFATVVLHPYWAATLGAGWLIYLGTVSAHPLRHVLRHFAFAILAYELVDLTILKHGMVSLWLSDFSHHYTRLIRQSYGYGEVSGPFRLNSHLLTFTIVAVTPWTRRSIHQLLWPVLQILLVVLLIALRPNLGREAPSLLATLTAFTMLHFLIPGNESTIPQPAGTAPAGLGRRFVALGGLVYPLLLLISNAPISLVARLNAKSDPADTGAILFVNDHPAGVREGGEKDITHFAPDAAVTSPSGFDRNRTQARYDKLAKKLLPALGYTVTVKSAEELVPEDLARYRLVVLICLQNPLSPSCKEALYASVKAGTTNVLIAGDHTDILGVQEPFNDIMASLGVHLNYDSAMPFGQWNTQIVHNVHPVNGFRALAPIGTAGDPGISVGASLSLDWRVAWPVLEAGDGFSDEGTPNAPSVAGLGDMQYNANEIRGGFALAAERPLGKGTILAFGDTAFLQNGTLTRNFAYVASIFRYLTRTTAPVQGTWLRGLALLCALLAVGTIIHQFSPWYVLVCLFLYVLSVA